MEKVSGHILSRRPMIVGTTGALALAGLGLRPRATHAQSSFSATPRKTEVPYFTAEKLNRSDIRIDTSTGAVLAGLPLYPAVTASRIDGGVVTLPSCRLLNSQR